MTDIWIFKIKILTLLKATMCFLPSGCRWRNRHPKRRCETSLWKIKVFYRIYSAKADGTGYRARENQRHKEVKRRTEDFETCLFKTKSSFCIMKVVVNMKGVSSVCTSEQSDIRLFSAYFFFLIIYKERMKRSWWGTTVCSCFVVTTGTYMFHRHWRQIWIKLKKLI